MDDKKLSDAVNRSGFPLQIALQSLVERTRPGGWRVIFSEHSWFNPTNDCSGFIDLVLESENAVTVLVVECKRVVESSWIFLIDDTAQAPRSHAKAWVTHYVNGNLDRFGFEELQPAPTTLQSPYCVVDGQNPKDRPMLERIASNVVSSTEGFAREEWSRVSNDNEALRTYFSVIVTTAKLRVCTFHWQGISLSTGEIPNAEYKEVPFLRFRKQLAYHRAIPKSRLTAARLLTPRYREIAAAKESTVLYSHL